MVKSRGLHVVYTARKGADGFYDVSHVVDSTASRPEWVFEETNLGAPSLKEVVGRLLKYWPGYKLYKRWAELPDLGYPPREGRVGGVNGVELASSLSRARDEERLRCPECGGRAQWEDEVTIPVREAEG